MLKNIFIGREHEQQCYRDLLSTDTPWVLIFTGLGQSGKSRLLRHLKEQTPPTIPVIKLDFTMTGLRTDHLSVLREIARQIEGACKSEAAAAFKKTMDEGRNKITQMSAQAKQDIIFQMISAGGDAVTGNQLKIQLDKDTQEIKWQVLEEMLDAFYTQLATFCGDRLVLMLDTCDLLKQGEVGPWVLDELIPAVWTRLQEQGKQFYVVMASRLQPQLNTIDKQDQRTFRLPLFSKSEVGQYLQHMGIHDPAILDYIYDLTQGHIGSLQILSKLCEQQEQWPSSLQELQALQDQFIKRVRTEFIEPDLLDERFIQFPYREQQLLSIYEREQRLLSIYERDLGPDHPDVVYLRNSLTRLHADQSQKSEVQRFFEDAGFTCMGLDEPIGFLGIPATHPWKKKIKHAVYICILTGKRLDGNDVLRIHDTVQGISQEISQDITLAFAVVDKPVEDHAWLQIAALRADNFSVIPIPSTLFTENQTLDKVISASALLDKHMERFLGQGADPYDVRHPIFDVLNFFGREALARDLIERMSSGQPIGLFGLRKMGKSSLMRYMQGLMPCPTAYLDLQAGIELTGLYKRLLHSWSNDAMVRFRADLNLSDANPGTGDPTAEFVKITQATLDRIASRNPEARLAIFLDEIEFIIPPLSATGTTLEHYLSLMHTLRGLLQEDGRILLMVAGIDPTINRMSRWGDEQKQNPFFMLLEELYLPPLFESDCIQMIRNIGTQVKISYSEAATAYVAQMSGGHPYLARQLCSLAYKQRHQRMGELTKSAMQQAVERFLFDPKYASSISASGLWGEVTNVKLWGEQAARANQDVLFTLAQSTDPIAESVITNGSDQAALRSALFSLQELSVIHPVEHPLGLGEPCYVISFGLFHSWIRRVRLGLEGGVLR